MFDESISEVCWQWWQSGQSVVSHLRRQSIYLAFSKDTSPSLNIHQLLKSETVTKAYFLNKVSILRLSSKLAFQNTKHERVRVPNQLWLSGDVEYNDEGRSCDSWNTLTYRLGIMVTMAAEPMVLMTGNDLINIVRTNLSPQLMFYCKKNVKCSAAA